MSTLFGQKDQIAVQILNTHLSQDPSGKSMVVPAAPGHFTVTQESASLISREMLLKFVPSWMRRRYHIRVKSYRIPFHGTRS